jgi:hypothetical protein
MVKKIQLMQFASETGKIISYKYGVQIAFPQVATP